MSGAPGIQSICRSIDHVMLRTENTEPLFSLLAETLCLPVTWPLQHSEFASFAWVHVGNTHLEIWAAKNNADLPAGCRLPLIHGLALEPDELVFSIAELERQGMACKQPRPFQTVNADGRSVTNFTNVVVLDLSSPACCNFFCDWGTEASIVPWATGIRTRERHEVEQRRFAEVGGGPLGVVRLARVGMTCPDVERTTGHWRTIAQIAANEPLKIDGVAFDVWPGDRHQIDSLSLEVRSLPEARAFLEQRGLLGRETPQDLTLSERATGGLVFHLVEAVAATN
ncbi:hypothetical protein J2W49_004457 [Hydrogenophaga palleronii]|uniref:Glyoxalase-like domain-containing protein n=1 Tax=Hydrogenophaga palleronii TaxID=65655 RepID=A0ABU1WT50_9BURK|nr:hypothetical protein [Hydrogenophaga palleronii]MDR7152481.1 hypothetical protein [Hydrogenophaga palleronii]